MSLQRMLSSRWFGPLVSISVFFQFIYTLSAIALPNHNPENLIGTPAVRSSKESAENPWLLMALILKAGKLIEEGDYLGAIPLLKEACEKAPLEATCHCDYGMALRLVGENDKAKIELLKAVELNKDSIKSWMNLWLLSEATGETKAADDAYKHYLQLNHAIADTEESKNHQRAADLFLRSRWFLGQQDCAGTASLLKQACELEPSFSVAHYMYGLVLTRLNRNEEAQAQFSKVNELSKQAVELDKNNAQAWLLVGNSYMSMGEVQAAADAFKECSRHFTGGLETQQVREYLDLCNKPDPQMGLNISKATALDDEGVEVGKHNNYTDAALLLQEACALVPSWAQLHSDYGMLLLKSKQTDKAKEQLLKAVELDQNLAPAWMNLGTLYKQAGELKAAINAYETSLSIDPNGSEAPTVRKLLVVLKEEQSKIGSTNSQAIALYNKAIALSLSKKDPAITLPLYKHVCELDPACATFHCEYGLALLGADQNDLAKEQFLKTIDLDKNCAVAWRNLSTVYESKGDLKAAVDSIQEFLRLEPNGIDSQKARVHLKGLQEAMRSGSSTSDDYFAAAIQTDKARWPDNKMPLKVYIESGIGIPGFKPQYEEILNQAFSDWANVSQGKVSFVFVNNKQTADITARWSNFPSIAHTPGEGGDALCRGDNAKGVLTHVVITIFTVDPNLTVSLSDGAVRQVALHEIGHALGIMGHSPNAGDVMFFSEVSYSLVPALSSRDIRTLQRLYATDLKPEWIKLLEESQVAAKSGNVDLAWQKCATAIKLLPSNLTLKQKTLISDLIRLQNQTALNLIEAGGVSAAEPYFRRALSMEDVVHDAHLPLVLQNYATLLRMTHRAAEIGKLEKRYGIKCGAN